MDLHVVPECNCRQRLLRSLAAGYTLVELVIVMLIVGILAAVAAPKYAESLASFRLQAAAQRISGDIQYIRRMAQQTSATKTIVFDVATSSYTVTGVSDVNHSSRTYRFSLTDLEYECALVSASFNGTATVTFDVYGHPNCAGTIVIRCGTNTLTLSLNAVGQVTVS